MIPNIITDTTITVVVDGQPYTTDRSNTNWERLVEALNSPNTDTDEVINLMSPEASIKEASEDYGEITIDNGTLYFNHRPVGNALAQRILDLHNHGFNLGPWVKFAQNVYNNPDVRARDELYLWLETSGLPITEDGHFLAYKIVSSEFKDLYTGRMDNSPGKIVSMPRENVDTNRDRTCSQGLHFCSKDYLPYFGSWRNGNDKVVLVKINPADVVSIPSDYDNAKGRTWRYEVLQEIDHDPMEYNWAPLKSSDGSNYEEGDDIWDEDDVSFDDDGDDSTWWETPVEQMFTRDEVNDYIEKSGSTVTVEEAVEESSGQVLDGLKKLFDQSPPWDEKTFDGWEWELTIRMLDTSEETEETEKEETVKPPQPKISLEDYVWDED